LTRERRTEEIGFEEKAFATAVGHLVPVALSAAVASSGGTPFSGPCAPFASQFEECSGFSPENAGRALFSVVSEFLHKGASAAFCTGERFVSEKTHEGAMSAYRSSMKEILGSLGFDIYRALSSEVVSAAREVGKFGGKLFESLVNSGGKMGAKIFAGACIAGLCVLFSAHPTTATPLSYSEKFEALAAASRAESRADRAANSLSDAVEKAAGAHLESEKKRIASLPPTPENESALLKTVVNRAALEKDIAAVRFLAILAEKSEKRKTAQVARFVSEGLGFDSVAEKMSKDKEFLRTCVSTAGIKGKWWENPEKTARRIFEEHAMTDFPGHFRFSR